MKCEPDFHVIFNGEVFNHNTLYTEVKYLTYTMSYANMNLVLYNVTIYSSIPNNNMVKMFHFHQLYIFQFLHIFTLSNQTF